MLQQAAASTAGGAAFDWMRLVDGVRRPRPLSQSRRRHPGGMAGRRRRLRRSRLLPSTARRIIAIWKGDVLDIGIPQSVGGMGRADACIVPDGKAIFASDHRGTPPEDVLMSRQVSWLAGRHLCLAFPTQNASVTLLRQRLAAYSCGGSSGVAVKRTGFPLSSGRIKNPKNHDGGICGQLPTKVNKRKTTTKISNREATSRVPHAGCRNTDGPNDLWHRQGAAGRVDHDLGGARGGRMRTDLHDGVET